VPERSSEEYGLKCLRNVKTQFERFISNLSLASFLGRLKVTSCRCHTKK
jgi:hypothetical protein